MRDIVPSGHIGRAIPEQVRVALFANEEPWLGRLLRLRDLMFEASRVAEVEIDETLKWSQPAYLPSRARIGTTVRLDAIRTGRGDCAVYFHCSTSLLESFRRIYGNDLRFVGNRMLAIPGAEPVPEAMIVHCAAIAFSYHRARRGFRGSSGTAS